MKLSKFPIILGRTFTMELHHHLIAGHDGASNISAYINLDAWTLKISESFFVIILLIGFLSFSRLEMNCFVVPSTAASSG